MGLWVATGGTRGRRQEEWKLAGFRGRGGRGAEAGAGGEGDNEGGEGGRDLVGGGRGYVWRGLGGRDVAGDDDSRALGVEDGGDVAEDGVGGAEGRRDDEGVAAEEVEAGGAVWEAWGLHASHLLWHGWRLWAQTTVRENTITGTETGASDWGSSTSVCRVWTCGDADRGVRISSERNKP